MLLAWIVVRLASVDIPLPVSTAMTAAILGVLIVFFAVIKNLADDYSTIWSYVGVVLAILVAVGAFQAVQEAGGIDTLRSELPNQTASTTSDAPVPMSSPPPPPPPPASETAPYEPPSAPLDPEPPAASEPDLTPDEPLGAPDEPRDDRQT